MTSEIRLVAYNMGQGGSKDKETWNRVLPDLAPDVLFVQESREPSQSWLGALNSSNSDLYWVGVPNGRWGSGIWVREGSLLPLDVPGEFEGRVTAAIIEGMSWPQIGSGPVVAVSIHAPTRKGSSYIKEVGRILDFIAPMSEGRPLLLAGDFNVVVGMREPGQPIGISRGERLMLERMRDELMLVPCWQTAHPGEQLARTLRWMRKLTSLPYHCDGLFIPQSWTGNLAGCEVLEEGEWLRLSDHNPVLARLAINT